MSERKSATEIIKDLFDALPSYKMASVQSLAEQIGSTWITVSNYLDLIYWVQNQPKVERVKGPRGYLWRRERRG